MHRSRPWRIHDLASDFHVEDVWALPARGGADDFPKLLEMVADLDPTRVESKPARMLWFVRDQLGCWLDRDANGGSTEARPDPLQIPGTTITTLASRLPDDLRDTATNLNVGSLPFKPLYCTHDEFAAEVSNNTVHAVMHLAWAPIGGDLYRGEMTVYVKPRGLFGRAYMAGIKPFRHWIVYPAMMREFEAAWSGASTGEAPLPT